MAEPVTLLNIGELSKPATVLVEKVCNAVGILYEPTRTTRLAKAEARVAAIMAHSAIEVSEIEQRGLERLIRQEGRKQKNIESITMHAASLLLPDAEPAGMDDDWISHFFSKCENVSDEEMQLLWARLLAGNANAPGSFSKRTVEAVSLLDKTDAQLFNDFCQFIWIREEDSFPFTLRLGMFLHRAKGFGRRARTRLVEAGLVHAPSISENYTPEMELLGSSQIRVRYHDSVLLLRSSEEEKVLPNGIGYAPLTRAGMELSRIAIPPQNPEYLLRSICYWLDTGKVSVIHE